MAGKKNPVKVKPSVLSSDAMRYYTPKPIEGAQRPAELTFNTTNRDKIKVQANFKRTNSQDTAELEYVYDDFLAFLEVIDEMALDSNETIEPMMLESKSNFAGGQYSEVPNPIGNLIVGRNGGVFWLSVSAGSGKPVVQWPLLESRFSKLRNRDGQEIEKARQSLYSVKAFSKKMRAHLAITIDDRYIPWQHRVMIEEGKDTPYSDPKVNHSYINTFNPGQGGNAGGGQGGGYTPPSIPDFDGDIPF